MGRRFENYKLKHKIRKSILESQNAIEGLEKDIAESKSHLETLQSDPTTPAVALATLKAGTREMEQALSELRFNHTRYTAQQRRPSVAFKRGIRAD